MRGIVVTSAASCLALVAIVIAIFGHVGQVNTSGLPRNLSMVRLNVSEYAFALRAYRKSEVPGLYSTNETSPLGEGLGIRHIYAWGLYSYCGYVEPNMQGGTCSGQSFARAFRPFEALITDTPDRYANQTKVLVPDTTAFKESIYMGSLTRPGSVFLVLGTIFAFLAFLCGLVIRQRSLTAASVLSILGSACLLIGISLWTSALNLCRTVNKAKVLVDIPLGIVINSGPGLWLFWASFICLVIASGPYAFSAISFARGGTGFEETW